MTSASETPHSLHYIRPMTVAYVRKHGPIAEAAAAAWADLRKAMRAGAVDADSGFGLVCRCAHTGIVTFDACSELASVAMDGELVLPTQIVKGGVHMTAAPVIGHASLNTAMEALLADPMIGHGLDVDLQRPAIITYSRLDGQISGGHWRLTLSAPLSWAMQRDRAA